MIFQMYGKSDIEGYYVDFYHNNEFRRSFDIDFQGLYVNISKYVYINGIDKI